MNTPGATLTVREARLGDLEEIVRLESLCFTDPWSAGALAGELVPDTLRLALAAELAGRLAGYLMAWKVVDQLHILNIAADPELRRRGVGTALLAEAVRRGRDAGLLKITLEVRHSNLEARAFYSKHGLRESGIRRGYYADDGEDAIIMTGPLKVIDTA